MPWHACLRWAAPKCDDTIHYSSLFPLAGVSSWKIIVGVVGGISLIALCIAFAKCIRKGNAAAENSRTDGFSNPAAYQEPPRMVYSVSGPTGAPMASMDSFNQEKMTPPPYNAPTAPTWNGDNACVTTPEGGAMAARGTTGLDNPA